MSDVSLKRLRELRNRAQNLHRRLESDLAPFVKEDGTFRRKPTSPAEPGDFNVTTTCSCLMALASTHRFTDFYDKVALPWQSNPDAQSIFRKLFHAAWMSSGLANNNAFTTTLVLRAYGYLFQEGLLDHNIFTPDGRDEKDKRPWDLNLGINNIEGLAHKLKQRADRASHFIWFSLSEKTKDLISKFVAGEPTDDAKLKRTVASDLVAVVQSGWIYEEERFPTTSASVKEKFTGNLNRYDLCEANRALLADHYPSEILPSALLSLKDIAEALAKNANNFSINEYQPSATILYWFVDAVWRAKISLHPDSWEGICNWAAKEFNHRRSLVVAEHDAVMDPVAMGMSACLCARLRTIGVRPEMGTTKDHVAVLPSLVELEHSIDELVRKQEKSGIWNKYFPLFHYQDAGSNFCFAFELLEAVLCEFGPDHSSLLMKPNIVAAFEKAVAWCEANKFLYSELDQKYAGWNSGGQLDSLERGQPESWATAVVHMFLSELVNSLSEQIQGMVLRKYKVRLPEKKTTKKKSKEGVESSHTALGEILDIDVVLDHNPRNICEIVRDRIVKPHIGETEKSLRRRPSKEPLSALLFGPPGTSKTQLVKAVADDLDWLMVEIAPSEFLKGNLTNIYIQANEIFEDLMDLSGVVILFDEMDALVQTRDKGTHLDIASQFLTTSMLPKLTDLHDRGQVVFFMATNFQDRFDAAIKRSGRFDLLLCMGPPKIDEKLRRLHLVYRLESETDQTKKAGELIESYIQGREDLQDKLSLFTFGEYRALLRQFGKAETIGDDIESHGEEKCIKKIQDASGSATLRYDELKDLRDKFHCTTLAELEKIQFTREELGSDPTQIERYMYDRKESKEQW